jgi:hypothetical protein
MAAICGTWPNALAANSMKRAHTLESWRRQPDLIALFSQPPIFKLN